MVYTADRLVQTAARNGSGRIAVASGIGTGEQLHPDWSPDGDSIAFSVDDSDGTRDIWVATVDGAPARIVDCADPCAFTDDPAWSPDGTRIAFHRGVGDGRGVGTATLETVASDGSDRSVVATTKRTQYPFAPRWSPDGTQIVVELTTFASPGIDEERLTARQLAIIQTATGALKPLTTPEVKAGSPDWNPAGDRILFVAPTDPTLPFLDVYAITETLHAMAVCRDAGYAAMVSHRSGETEDAFIADLAVGSGCGQLKSGAPARGERIAKYNRLLEIADSNPDMPYGQ